MAVLTTVPIGRCTHNIHTYNPHDVICECGAMPTPLGQSVGLVPHPERAITFDAEMREQAADFEYRMRERED